MTNDFGFERFSLILYKRGPFTSAIDSLGALVAVHGIRFAALSIGNVRRDFRVHRAPRCHPYWIDAERSTKRPDPAESRTVICGRIFSIMYAGRFTALAVYESAGPRNSERRHARQVYGPRYLARLGDGRATEETYLYTLTYICIYININILIVCGGAVETWKSFHRIRFYVVVIHTHTHARA